MESEKKNIVILGAGFGGLRTALLVSKKLRRSGLRDRFAVKLVDKNEYHTYTPTLYEAATTSKDLANMIQLRDIVTFSLPAIIKNTDIELVRDHLVAIHPDQKIIETGQGTIPYAYLVFALGSEPNYYGIPGLEEHSLPLKSVMDAIKIRDKIFEFANDPDQKNIRIIIGGGGSTGVELAGEIQLWLCHLKKNDIGQDACWGQITIVEGAATILNGFPEKVVTKVQERFKKIGGVNIVIDRIMAVNESALKLQSGTLMPYDLLVWTGGVKPNHFSETFGVSLHEKTHRIVVEPSMRAGAGVYVLGDAAHFINPITNLPVPGVARAALSQADVVAKNLLLEIKAAGKKKKPAHFASFVPKNYPYVIPVGGKYAVARVGSTIISGLAGWILKCLVELNYLWSIMNPWMAFKLWIKGLKIFIQNERLG